MTVPASDVTIEKLARVAVVGTSGCGKTTFARRLATTLAVPHVELDVLHWQPNWTAVPTTQFRNSVDAATAQPGWVCDGNYRPVRDLVWERATTIVWLNYSFPVVFGRVLRRTIVRSLSRKEVFPGSRESLRLAFFSRESILLWVLKTFWRHRREYPQLLAEPQFAHLQQNDFRHPWQTERWLQTIEKLQAGDNLSQPGSALQVGGPAC